MSKIVRNALIYSIGNILPQAAAIILLPLYTHYLAPAEYGIVTSMSVISAILAILLTMSVERSIYRLCYDYKEEDAKKRFLGNVFVSMLLSSTAVLVMVFLFNKLIGNIFPSIKFYPYYVYAIFTCYFMMFSQVPKICYQLKGKATNYFVLSMAQFVTSTILILYYVCVVRSGAVGMLKAQLYSYLLFMPIYLLITFRAIRFSFDMKIFRDILAFSLPIAPTLIFAWILNLSDRIFLERFIGLQAVGIYSAGYKMAMGVTILFGGVQLAYNPYFFKLANNGQVDSKDKLIRINNDLAIFFLFIAFLISLFSREIVVYLMNARYLQAYSITRIVVFSYYLSALLSFVNMSIYQQKNTKRILFIIMFVAILNIMLNLSLIPFWGIYGAAFATLISFMIWYIVQYNYSKRAYFLPMDWAKLLPLVIGALAIVLLYQYVLEGDPILSFLTKIILAGIGAIWLYNKHIVKYYDIRMIYSYSKFQSQGNVE